MNHVVVTHKLSLHSLQRLKKKKWKERKREKSVVERHTLFLEL
jgi:hypothetical protein